MTKILESVSRFYSGSHFNLTDSMDSRLYDVLSTNIVKQEYPDLHRRLSRSKGIPIVEIGCGTGWLVASLMAHYRKEIIGIDYSHEALSEANKLLKKVYESKRGYFTKRNFPMLIASDLRKLPTIVTEIDLVSLGVLHHTDDTFDSINSILGWAPNCASLYIGLYHNPSRAFFLELFNEKTEDEKFKTFSSMFTQSRDEVHLKSWFRDQLLHVHESSHSLADLSNFLKTKGFILKSTSLNKFSSSLEESIESLDAKYADYARRQLKSGHFIPGFFTALFLKEGGIEE